MYPSFLFCFPLGILGAPVGLITLLALISLITSISKWMMGLLLETNGHSDWRSLGAPCSGFWNSFLPWLFFSLSQESKNWKEATEWEIFFFAVFSTSFVNQWHCTFGFQFCFHLFPLSIFSVDNFSSSSCNLLSLFTWSGSHYTQGYTK